MGRSRERGAQLDRAEGDLHPAKDVRRTATASLLLLLSALPAVASAQTSGAAPEPPSPGASEDDIDDTALIRWASEEVRIYERRPVAPPLAPIPPDSYLGTGIDGPLVLPDQSGHDAVRVLAELGGGALGVLIGGGLGALIVWGAVEEHANPDWMIVAVGAGTAIGAFAVTGGVVLAADLTGGRGNFGEAFIGQVIGCAAALPLVTIAMANDALPLAIVSAGVLPLAGAILGYEISHANADGASTAPRQIAFLSPTLGGAVAGVRGELP